MNYKIFVYDSHNTGYYINGKYPKKTAEVMAVKLSKAGAKRARIEAENANAFKDYERGELTSWNII